MKLRPFSNHPLDSSRFRCAALELQSVATRAICRVHPRPVVDLLVGKAAAPLSGIGWSLVLTKRRALLGAAANGPVRRAVGGVLVG